MKKIMYIEKIKIGYIVNDFIDKNHFEKLEDALTFVEKYFKKK